MVKTDKLDEFLSYISTNLIRNQEYRVQVTITKGISDRQGGWENCTSITELIHGQETLAQLKKEGLPYESDKEMCEDETDLVQEMLNYLKSEMYKIYLNNTTLEISQGGRFKVISKSTSHMKQQDLF